MCFFHLLILVPDDACASDKMTVMFVSVSCSSGLRGVTSLQDMKMLFRIVDVSWTVMIKSAFYVKENEFDFAECIEA